MKTVIEMAREVLLLDERDNPNDNGIAQFIGTLTDFAELVRADERNRTWTQEHWTEYERSIAAQERQRIVNLLMVQHDMAKRAHNYWHVAAQLIRDEFEGRDDDKTR